MLDSEDLINAVRRSLLPQLHYLLRGSFGGYAVSHTTAEEYALTAHCQEQRLEEILDEIGFSRNPIASLKVRVDGNTSEGSWVWRPSPLADGQLHIVLHALEDGTGVDVYAHWEYSWIRHPYKHYIARGYDAEIGVQLARRWLTSYGRDELAGTEVPYEIDSSFSRRASEALSLSYYRLEDVIATVEDRVPLLEDVSLEIDRTGNDDLSASIVER
ncbi:hypothetical protein [Halopiger aswanensis]|uniref:Uncharacterized protein n=1 Tax=Halopiger aswanensis TaxID=148449 RepID=A0A419WR75_9EURY|nr:hypothetical protein [Halopiger aswanensis]RKD97918.1 hypothetical protein ATJ93_0916 [Halopiger aswanensis]